MIKPLKIVITGIGGVGGYYGGLLAREYINKPEVEVYFLSRGKNLEAIRENGLKVITETETFIARPKLATDNPLEIGFADYVLICTKSYHLNSVIEHIKPCLKPSTVVLPLLNGADITERIQDQLPESIVWHGCVYIVSRLNKPGEVQSSGGVHDLFFGSANDELDDTKQKLLLGIMIRAGVKAIYSVDILSVIWKKFIFISVTASLTTYFDVGFRDLLTDTERKNLTMKFLEEISAIARAVGVKFNFDIIDTTLRHISRLPEGTTSSMHTDFLKGRKTELDTLTAVVPHLAAIYGIETPMYNFVYQALKQR